MFTLLLLFINTKMLLIYNKKFLLFIKDILIKVRSYKESFSRFIKYNSLEIFLIYY
jgi:hypothetical protein